MASVFATPATAYYLATVWMDEWHDCQRRVIRLQACGPDDFKARVRELWPSRFLTFGPVSRSKVQHDAELRR